MRYTNKSSSKLYGKSPNQKFVNTVKNVYLTDQHALLSKREDSMSSRKDREGRNSRT